MANIVCGRCGRRTLAVSDAASIDCPRCGNPISLRGGDRVIRARREVPILRWFINLVILAAVGTAGWYLYGQIAKVVDREKDRPAARERTPLPSAQPQPAGTGATPATPAAAPPGIPPPTVEPTIDLSRLRREASVPVKVVEEREFFERLDRVAGTTAEDLERVRRLLLAIGEPDEPEFGERARAAIRDHTPAIFDPSDGTICVRAHFDPTLHWTASPEVKAAGRDAMLLRAAVRARLQATVAASDDDLTTALRMGVESAVTCAVADLLAQGAPPEFAQALVKQHQLGRDPSVSVRDAIIKVELDRADRAAASGAGMSGFVIARHFFPASRLCAAPLSTIEALEAGRKRTTMRFRKAQAILPGWTLLDENTLGPQGLLELGRLTFGRFGVFSRGSWAGDRWALFEKDGRRALVLCILSPTATWQPFFVGRPDSPPGAAYGRMVVNVFGSTPEEGRDVFPRAVREATMLDSEKLDDVLAFLRSADPPSAADAADRLLGKLKGTADLPAELLYACTAYPERSLAWLEDYFNGKYFFPHLPDERQQRFVPLLLEAQPRASDRLKEWIRRVTGK